MSAKLIIIAVLIVLGFFIFSKTSSSKITTEQARMVVQNLPEVQDFLKEVPDAKVEVDNEDQEAYNVHVYEVKNGHTATFNWYRVNTKTGKPKAQFDLNKAEGT